MVRAEQRQTPYGDAVLLVGPGELEPEVALRQRRRGVAAGDEQAQRGIAVHTELVNARLERAELLESAA